MKLRNIALFCAIGALVAAPAHAALRLFFSTIGAAEDQSLLAANPGLTLPIPRTNPAVASGTRLYLWGEMTGGPTSQRWAAISSEVIVEGGRVTDRRLYNYESFDPGTGALLYQRWWGVNSGTIQADGSVTGSNISYFPTGEGLSNSANTATYDLQSEVGALVQQGVPIATARTLTAPAGFNGKATLLGFYDVQLNAGSNSARVFIRVGTGGIARSGGLQPPNADPIYFGVGDENTGLTGASFGSRSPLPDATIVPEPAGPVALLVLVCALLHRRRQSRRSR